MPKLSPVQWVVVIVFFAFYGFAVFALTRDYYLRHPSQLAAVGSAVQSPHALARTQQQTWIQKESRGRDGSIPTAVTETNPVLLGQKADDLFGQKRYAEAIPLYRHLLELESGNSDAYNDLGLALHYTGQSAEALKTLRVGTAKDPEFQRIWLTLGFVSAQMGDEADAKVSLEKARDLKPDNGIGREAVRMLGLLQEQ